MLLARKKILIYMLLTLIANSGLAENVFYNDRERGWYYHECLSCKKLEKFDDSKKIPLREMDAEQVLDLLASVQKEMEVRQARYTLEPTVENAHDFLNYQRLMFKNGSQASKAMQTVLLKYPYLDPRVESPVHSQAIKIKALESEEVNNAKIKEFAQHFKLLYFFKADCPYCHEFQPVLERVAREFSFKVEAISSDGIKLKNFATKFDNNLAKKLNVTTYPTIIAYNSKNNIYLPVSYGFTPEADLKFNIIHVYEHVLKLAMEVK